jgi:hypothetical protein
MLINKTHVKNVAKAYGRQLHDKDLQVSAGFLEEINDIVLALVAVNVAKQDKLAGTLRDTEWAKRSIKNANSFIERAINEES